MTLVIIVFIISIILWLGYRGLSKNPTYILCRLEKQITISRSNIFNKLRNRKNDFEKKLEDFIKKDRVVEIIYGNKEEILEHIKGCENELQTEDDYIRLNEKFRHDISKRVQIAMDFYNWIVCSEYLDANFNAWWYSGDDPKASEELNLRAQEFRIRRQEIKKRFQELLKE